MTTPTTTDLTIVEGRVRLHTVDHVIHQPNVDVWTVDCDSKYAEPVLVWNTETNGSYSHEVYLVDTEHTQNIDTDTDTLTSITLPPKPETEDWTCVVDGSRYMFTIVLYRMKHGFYHDHTWVSSRYTTSDQSK